MKRCGACRQEKPKEEFTKNRSRKDGLNPTCTSCHRPRVRFHYRNNPDFYMSKAVSRRSDMKSWVNSLKVGPCHDCRNEFNPWQMDFDHREPSSKSECVSRMIQLGASKDRILKEIEKCDLVCANCHRDRTHKRGYSNAPVAQRIMRRSTEPDIVGSNPTGGAKWPDESTLKEMIWRVPASTIAEMLGVSGSAVKKRCKKLGLETPGPGYWARVHPNSQGL